MPVQPRESFERIPAILAEVAKRGKELPEGITAALFGDYFSANSGRLFDEIVMTTDPMRFEYGDLVAINMLSVDLHHEGVATLLFDRPFSAECSALLRDIPVGLPLWQLPVQDLEPTGAGPRLWSAVQDRVKGTKQGFTVLSKLMAAKRPHLFPVWDTLVDGMVERPNRAIWRPMHDLLSDEAVRTKIEDLTAGAPPHVSLLRRVDVALWREADRRRRGIASTMPTA